ncbi:MAG: glycosyltransferase family 4 protein [Anaerolineales bacterium]|nr:MAG: glycosyltransferase family 4 protein [Anaerolineales bacterium]
MKVLHLVHQYPPANIGGTEVYTESVAHALAKRGHEVTVLYRGSSPGVGLERHEEDDVMVVKTWAGLLSPNRRFLATLRDVPIEQAFERVLDETRPDLIHIQHLMSFPETIISFIREQAVPFLITLHDYWWFCANAQLLTNYSRRLCEGPRAYLNCARCVLARVGFSGLWPAVPALAILMSWRGSRLRSATLQASRLIAPSHFVKEQYCSHAVPADRIEVLPHGLEWPQGLKQRQGSARAVRLAYVGGLSWQKGVHILVDAVRELRGAVELWIAGDESFDPRYVGRLRDHVLPNQRFLGHLSRERVWELLSQTDVVVVPSLWHETFSLIVHEAFATGVPVVASRVGALTEAIRDGEDGLLVPPGDVDAWRATLQRLVDERDLLAKLQASVRTPMAVEEHTSRLESIYASVL